MNVPKSNSFQHILILLFLLPSLGFSQKIDLEKLPELDKRIQAISEIGLIKGFGLSIFSSDEIYFSKGYGQANAEKEIPYTPETLQNIGSVSKTLIGISLLKAKELGLLKLDDPISDYLDFTVVNPYFPEEQITIRHLATHTSTIQDTDLYDQKAYYLLDEAGKNSPALAKQSEEFHVAGEQASMQEYLTYFLSPNGKWYNKKNFLKKRPGTKYEYSNVGAALAAYVIERAAKTSYQEFTRKYILSPLGMEASGWSYDEIEEEKHSILYNEEHLSYPQYALVTYPDGGLITSHRDLSIYLMELMKAYRGAGTLLEKESYAELFKQQLPIKKKPRKISNKYNDEFNSGIFMGFSPAGWVGHSGSDPGILCFMFFDPEIEVGHIISLNTSVNGESIEQQIIPLVREIDRFMYGSTPR